MRALLSQGLSELGLDMSRVETLERFSSLLLEKNNVMNLTAITAREEIAVKHFLDSLTVLSHVSIPKGADSFFCFFQFHFRLWAFHADQLPANLHQRQGIFCQFPQMGHRPGGGKGVFFPVL